MTLSVVLQHDFWCRQFAGCYHCTKSQLRKVLELEFEALLLCFFLRMMVIKLLADVWSIADATATAVLAIAEISAVVGTAWAGGKAQATCRQVILRS